MSENMPDAVWVGWDALGKAWIPALGEFKETPEKHYLKRPSKYISDDRHQSELAAYKAAARDMAAAIESAAYVFNALNDAGIGDGASVAAESLLNEALIKHAALIEAEGE